MKKTSEFDVNGFLSGMFNEPSALTTTKAATAPEPATVHAGDGRPELESTAQIAQLATVEIQQLDELQTFAVGDLLPADGEWDSLPVPEPCPTCGGIDCWWGLWGERRCERCEPAGRRSLLLAERAERLRERTASRRRGEI